MAREVYQGVTVGKIFGCFSFAIMVSLFLMAALSLRVDAATRKDASKKGQVSRSYPAFSPYPPMYFPVRVGISPKSSGAKFAVWAPACVFQDGRPVFELRPQTPYHVDANRIVELGTGRSFPMPRDQRVHITASNYIVWTNNRWYRGCLELAKVGNRLTVINLLDLEDYLFGVVPSEMPSNWHPEALKAQAVAARSYAWAHLGSGSKWRSEGFDLVPDVRDQMYKGIGAEAASTCRAVKETSWLILKDSGRVKPGFYRAWVGDAFENLNIRKTRVEKSRLEKVTGVKNIVGVTIKQWDASGNAHNIQVMGDKKNREVYGVALAKMLGLATAGILDVDEVGNYWEFTYRGPGNGARGLSQHGANMLAKNGWRFDQILQQYYQDADGQLRLDYVNNLRSPVTKSR